MRVGQLGAARLVQVRPRRDHRRPGPDRPAWAHQEGTRRLRSVQRSFI